MVVIPVRWTRHIKKLDTTYAYMLPSIYGVLSILTQRKNAELYDPLQEFWTQFDPYDLCFLVILLLAVNYLVAGDFG